jgi:hypothetical protein
LRPAKSISGPPTIFSPCACAQSMSRSVAFQEKTRGLGSICRQGNGMPTPLNAFKNCGVSVEAGSSASSRQLSQLSSCGWRRWRSSKTRSM